MGDFPVSNDILRDTEQRPRPYVVR
jgi:hypothetical protein